MTERELLELAAKAAGYKVRASEAGTFGIDDGQYWIAWNPLIDDGDALRLAVEVNLLVDCHSACARPLPDSIPWQGGSGDDAYEATRRAIVMAAAEIGKAMGDHVQ